MTGDEHIAEAEQALTASAWQRQNWGETGERDDLRSATWETDRALVHAVLAVARELADLRALLGGIRDELSRGLR